MSSAEKLEMEDIIREEKSRRSRESASQDVTENIDEDEAGEMGDIKNQVQYICDEWVVDFTALDWSIATKRLPKLFELWKVT